MSRTLCSIATLVVALPALAHDGDPKLLQRQPMYAGTGWRNAQLAQRGQGGPALVTVPPVPFAHSGVTLLSWLSLPDLGVPAGGNGNSCYGYVAPSGREYALIGLSTGTAFVEITQPASPTIVAQITGPQSLWRDVRTYSHYAYAISEGGSGIQVIDLAAIDAGVVTLVNTIDDDATHATHTLTIDPVSGYLYRSGGASQGLRIYDVGANQVNPPRVGTWSPRYVHEPSVFTFTSGPAAGKQIAFCCGQLNGSPGTTGLYVVDVTNKASPTQLQFLSYPSAKFAHQCWPSPDMRWLYLDDELDDQDLGVTSTIRVFDIANPLAPTFAGTFTNGNGATDHNLYTRGDLIFQSAYRSGLRVYKTSTPGTPTSPVEVAWFDTWPDGDSSAFNGLWNNYPWFPSGVVIGSDIERGLFVWWVGAQPLALTVLGGAPTAIDPGGETIHAHVDGNAVAGSLELRYDAGAGFVSTPLVQASNGDWYASLPPTACGTAIAYYLAGRTPNGVTWTEPADGFASPYLARSGFGATVVQSQSFDASAAGWVAGAAGDTATSGVWTRVNPNGTAAQPEDDHTPGAGGSCWVTGQGAVGGALGDADVDGGRTTLVTATFDAASVPNALVSYWRWFSNDEGVQDDQFKVDVSNDGGSTWTNVETLGPTGPEVSGGWFRHEFRVASFVTPTSSMKLRFVATDGGQGSVVEAAIDDFEVSSGACSGFDGFCTGDGSESACPCANQGSSGAGCASSAFASGALLSASGSASVASDTLALDASSVTGLDAVFFQGDAALAPFAVDDGLGCVGGTVLRLGTQSVSSASSHYPRAGDPTIAVRGAIPAAGGTRYYQCFYRNAASFCTPATSNRTNGVVVVWGP